MSNYFKQIPNFEYVNRLPDSKISDYIEVKNFFKKGVLREDIFQDVTLFTKYQIQGNDRPDNVAYNFYGDSNLDWLVLVCNNIINVQTEWPMTQENFDTYLLRKYGDYTTIYDSIHHYKTPEIKNSRGVTIVSEGLQVDPDFSISYFDFFTNQQINLSNIAIPVSNYEYEEEIENEKRNIFLLKEDYLSVVKDDLDEIMTYKKGSTQYISETLKRADNIRLYQ